MHKKYLTLLPAIALLVFVRQARAIGITLDSGILTSYAVSGTQAPWQLFKITHTWRDHSQLAIRKQVQTLAQVLGRLQDSHTQTLLRKLKYIFRSSSQITSFGPQAEVFSSLGLTFTLTEVVTYTLTGSFMGNLADDSTTAYNDGLAGANTSLVQLSPFLGFYATTPSQTTGGAFNLLYGPTETLTPGTYQINFGDTVRYGTTGSVWARTDAGLILNAIVQPPPPGGTSVPDGGSAMTMLGMALTAIGGIRHKLKISQSP